MFCDVMLCHGLLCHAAMFCSVMYVLLCYAMFCDAVLCYGLLCHGVFCYALLCSVMSCSVVFVEGARRDTRGYSGILGDSRDNLGSGGRAAVCRVGLAGGQFLKSNNPKLSGGERVWPVPSCSALVCSVML